MTLLIATPAARVQRGRLCGAVEAAVAAMRASGAGDAAAWEDALLRRRHLCGSWQLARDLHGLDVLELVGGVDDGGAVAAAVAAAPASLSSLLLRDGARICVTSRRCQTSAA